MIFVIDLSANSGGTLTPWAVAARIYVHSSVDVHNPLWLRKERTVSIIPDALGLPSTRMGLPPMYLEIFMSRGSRVGLNASAAAVGVKKLSRSTDNI